MDQATFLLPADTAPEIAARNPVSALVICAASRELKKIEVSSWGREADDKLWTGHAGDRMMELLGGNVVAAEDFRAAPAEVTAAYCKEALELLQEIVRQGGLSPLTTDRVVKLLART